MEEHLTLYIKKYLLDCSCKFIFIIEIVNSLDYKNLQKKNKTPPQDYPTGHAEGMAT